MSHLRGLTLVTLAAALRVGADANRAGVDVSAYSGEGILILQASATEAADNTLAVKIQDSPDNVTFTDVVGAAFAPVTNAAASLQQIHVNVDSFQKYIRVVDDIGGTTPECARCVLLLAKKDRT